MYLLLHNFNYVVLSKEENMKNKLFFLMMLICMMLSTVYVYAQGDVSVLDNGKCGDSLYWELLSDGTLHIYGEGKMYDYLKYTIPSPWYKYRDEPYISEDGKTFLNSDGTSYMGTAGYYKENPNNYKIKEIKIDPGVTYLGDWAFYRVCVKELTIPEGVESTGHFCIRFSPTLEKVNLPDSLISLNDFAISRNYLLETINFGNKLEKAGYACFQNNKKLKKAIFPDTLVSIGEQMHEPYGNVNYTSLGFLDSCESLTEVKLGHIENIPQRTFLNTSIENVIIPSTVKNIGEYAFGGCEKLKTVVFDKGSLCNNIESQAFYKCTSLESITGGIRIEKIAPSAFTSAYNISEFEFSDTNLDFPKNLFYKQKIKTAIIGAGIKEIATGLFMSSSLENIYISRNLKKINSSAFYNCPLNNIYYYGTKEEWDKIEKVVGWNSKITGDGVIHYLGEIENLEVTNDIREAVNITDDKIKLFIDLYNNSTMSNKAFLNVASYNEKDQMLTVNKEELVVEAGDISNVELSIENDENFDYIKVFIWNEYMMPIEAALKIEISE